MVGKGSCALCGIFCEHFGSIRIYTALHRKYIEVDSCCIIFWVGITIFQFCLKCRLFINHLFDILCHLLLYIHLQQDAWIRFFLSVPLHLPFAFFLSFTLALFMDSLFYLFFFSLYTCKFNVIGILVKHLTSIHFTNIYSGFHTTMDYIKERKKYINITKYSLFRCLLSRACLNSIQ